MERLQKILASAGLGSRRECESLILQGRVTIDGQVVKELGFQADPETQNICCDHEKVKIEPKRCYLFYKPKNCVCTNAPEQGIRVIDYFSSISYRLFTIGRLDKDSEGLILVTNNGDLAQKLAHPKYQIEKVYHVVVHPRFSKKDRDALMQGVWIDAGKIIPESVHILKSSDVSSILEIRLREGKNRVIRRILAKIGFSVSRLIRVQFGPFQIETLKAGQYRLLQESEWQNCLKAKPHPKMKPVARSIQTPEIIDEPSQSRFDKQAQTRFDKQAQTRFDKQAQTRFDKQAQTRFDKPAQSRFDKQAQTRFDKQAQSHFDALKTFPAPNTRAKKKYQKKGKH